MSARRIVESVEVDRMVSDFKLFVSERISQAEVREQRVTQAVAFLKHDSVTRARLSQRIHFLKRRGFNDGEIEDALERVDDRDYLAFLNGKWDDGEGIAAAGYTAVAGVDAAGAADLDGSVMLESQMGAAGDTDALNLHSLWRVGAIVYAYKSDCSYFPVPLIGFDHSRAEDVIMIAHQTPSGEYGHHQYYPAGFKGIVPDEFAPFGAVRLGVTVIAEFPGAYRNHFKEAVVVKKSEKRGDGEYTVDLEWVHTSEISKGVDFHSFRLLQHPRYVLRQIHDEEERRKQLGNVDQVASASSFRVLGQQQISDASEGRRVREEADITKITTHVRNFIKFPHLDIGEQPRGLRTGAAFSSQYGETTSDGLKHFPLEPSSQVEKSSLGFGFNLTSYDRHPESRAYYHHNPIIDIAEQCVSRETMFVDPDFPPSLRSLYGAGAEACPEFKKPGEGKILQVEEESESKRYVWRRASETMFRPRVNVIGSKPRDMWPGDFTPPWLINVIATLTETAEFEDMISPGEDGWIFGAYVVRLFIDGRWAYVVIDDYIPCDAETNRPVSMISGNPNEIYPCLIEKAFAKLEGSYDQLKYRRPSFTMPRAWEDVTGSIAEKIDHDMIFKKDAVNENLRETVTRDYSFCKIHAQCRGEETRDNDMGFHPGVHWFVDAIAQYIPPVKDQGQGMLPRKAEPQYYYHVARAPGQGPQIVGIEGKREKFFQLMPPQAIDCFPDVSDSTASYWMSSNDYFRIFNITVLLWYLNNSQKACFEGTFEGRDCGGKMHGLQQWLSSPQLMMRFVQSAQVMIEVKLLDRRIRPKLPLKATSLQLHLLKGKPTGDPLTTDEGVLTASAMANLVDDHEAVHHPSTTLRLTVPSGNYVAIPSIGNVIGDASECEGYIIKVFSVAAFDIQLVN